MTDRSKKLQLNMSSTPKPALAPASAFDPIAAALQQIHSKVTDEKIPDDFMRLLDQFDAEVTEQ